MDDHVERAERLDLGEHALRGDVAADEHRLHPERRQLAGGLLRRSVVAQIPERDARGAPSRANRFAIASPIPRVPPVTRTDAGPLTAWRGSGSSAGAELGSSLPAGPRTRLPLALVGLGRGVGELLEQRHPLLAVAAHLVFGRQVANELLDPRAQLEREVRGRRPDECLDVVDRRIGHRAEA